MPRIVNIFDYVSKVPSRIAQTLPTWFSWRKINAAWYGWRVEIERRAYKAPGLVKSVCLSHLTGTSTPANDIQVQSSPCHAEEREIAPNETEII
jgi:hypothetical protein